MHINRTTVIGRLGRTCTVSTVPGGSVAINFSLCHKKHFRDKNGMQREQLTWYECSIWRAPGESTEISNRLVKGALVFVEGEVGAIQRSEGDVGRGGALLTLRIKDISFLNTPHAQPCEDTTTL